MKLGSKGMFEVLKGGVSLGDKKRVFGGVRNEFCSGVSYRSTTKGRREH